MKCWVELREQKMFFLVPQNFGLKNEFSNHSLEFCEDFKETMENIKQKILDI